MVFSSANAFVCNGQYAKYSPSPPKPPSVAKPLLKSILGHLGVAFFCLLGALIPLRGLFLLRASAKCASTLCSRLNVPFSSFLQGIIKINFASALASCVSCRRLGSLGVTVYSICPGFPDYSFYLFVVVGQYPAHNPEP